MIQITQSDVTIQETYQQISIQGSTVKCNHMVNSEVSSSYVTGDEYHQVIITNSFVVDCNVSHSRIMSSHLKNCLINDCTIIGSTMVDVEILATCKIIGICWWVGIP